MYGFSKNIKLEGILFRKLSSQQIETAKNFFDMGLSPERAYKQPGTPGRQACQKLWRFWAGKTVIGYNYMTDERQIMAKLRHKLAFQRILFKLELQLRKIEDVTEYEYQFYLNKVKKLRDRGREDKIEPYRPKVRVENLRLQILQTLFNLQDRMAAVEASSTDREKQEDEVLRNLEEIQERLMKS